MPRAMSGNEDAPDHWLRITNPHGESITVSVTGRDERGTKSGTYRRELPAYRSVKVKMRDIEAAFDATNPEGWWTLTVTAGGTVHVVPMMRHGDTRIVLPVARPGSCPGPGSVTRSREAGALLGGGPILTSDAFSIVLNCLVHTEDGGSGVTAMIRRPDYYPVRGVFAKRSRGRGEWTQLTSSYFDITGTRQYYVRLDRLVEEVEWDMDYRLTAWDGPTLRQTRYDDNRSVGPAPGQSRTIRTKECTTPLSPPPEPEPPSPLPEPEPETPEPEACPAEPACDHIAIVPSMPRTMSGNEDGPDHWLRITNPHGESITVSVTGRDERGTKSGTYRRELPAYRSVKVKMRDIEAAFDATEPEGWWTLTVTAGGTVHVVPMMRHGATRFVLPVARPGSCPGPGGVTRSR